MKLYKLRSSILLEYQEEFFQLEYQDWDQLLNQNNLFQYLEKESEHYSPIRLELAQGLLSTEILAPIGSQEVWAAGVTYFRSRSARMEESKAAGGDSFYDKVYEADRPELFFKATPARTVGHKDVVRIRSDSSWNVPEPELTLFINCDGNIVAYTIGNDMSSRSIEGENPLYLPQAKIYEGCAALGPCLLIQETPLPPDTPIYLEIIRNRERVVFDKTALSNMKRQPEELKEYLLRGCEFPQGVFLMTGTGIVPDEFTLLSGDEINITIPPIGMLHNWVEEWQIRTSKKQEQ